MTNTLRIAGFKCFIDDTFQLKNITVLTGNNGAGKSSLIQALLLARLAIEKNLRHDRDSDYSSDEKWNNILVALNNGYELRLGTIFDIIRDTDNVKNTIRVSLDNECFEFFPSENEEENTSLKVDFISIGKTKDVPAWRKKEFYYINTERLGPRHYQDFNFTDFIHCGFRGELTAQVLVNVSRKRTYSTAMLLDAPTQLEKTTNEWLNLICPGTEIFVVSTGEMSAQIRVKGSATKSAMLATNIGFGISYVLPIIVTGLIAIKGSFLIVENPEAHLHPKGQSNIGYFLGKVAEAGVKVLIETHSEHVVNGIRRATLSSEELKTEDVNIYFFKGFNEKKSLVKEIIEIEARGNLSKFPMDFFDQVNQDISEILKLSQKI